MSSERPSPFTIPEPQFKFCEGPATEPVKPITTTIGELIRNLTAFAVFYEGKTEAIGTASPAMQPWHLGDREGEMRFLYLNCVRMPRLAMRQAGNCDCEDCGPGPSRISISHMQQIRD